MGGHRRRSAGGANLTNSYGLTHPSRPNYLQLFSGSHQGVTGDSCYTPGFSSAPNLASELIAAPGTRPGRCGARAPAPDAAAV